MSKIIFSTNLDEAKRFVHTLNNNYFSSAVSEFVPRKGERIRFYPSSTFEFELEVVDVTYCMSTLYDLAHVKIELHIPSYLNKGISEWSRWLKDHL